MRTEGAALLVAEVRKAGASLRTEDDRLLVNAPRGVVGEDLREAMRSVRQDLLELLANEELVLGMSFKEFRSTDYRVEIDVEGYDETQWLVPGSHQERQLMAKGIDGARIWTAALLETLWKVSTMARGQLRSIAKVLWIFKARIIGIEGKPTGNRAVA